jgi:hypothetical protein
MRLLFILACSAILWAGCRHPKPAEDPSAAFKPKKLRTNKGSDSHQAVTPPKPLPRATALNEIAGKVSTVNASSRFAVLDFYLTQLPAVDQRLGVYRQGQKVGEVRITGPARDHIIAADITAGEAQAGDEVRSN